MNGLNNGNKYYRYGVLEGNHTEERFGLDLVEQPKYQTNYLTEAQDKISLNSSAASAGYIPANTFIRQDPHKEKFSIGVFPVEARDREEKGIAHQFSHTNEALKKYQERQNRLDINNDMKKDVGFKHEGERLHVFFGHGLDDSKFENRELATTNSLSYDQQVKPQQFIGSRYENTAQRVDPTLEKDYIYNKHHLKDVKEIGDKTDLQSQKPYRSYDEFTKKYDSVQSKISWRK